MTHILVAEDDATVAEVVVAYLEREGFDVTWKSDGADALEYATVTPPDLLVLDLMLPSVDGLQICQRLHERSPVPVIMLTARGDETDRIEGLDVGADDYLTKPFSPRELVARVKAILRRSGSPDAPPPDSVLTTGDLTVDVTARVVTRGDRVIDLTVREFDLLAFLMARPRVAFRREQLLEHVWGYTYGDASTVTVHIRRLREKIEEDASNPTLISTVWGVGYRWDG